MRDLFNKYGRFNELWSRYRSWVWLWSLLYARNDVEIGHDFSQEVAIALFLNIDNLFARPSSLSEFRWVKRVSFTTLGKHGHKDKIDITALSDKLERTLIEENNQAQELIKELMVYLPDDDRKFLQLYLENYKSKEIAKIMGITESAAKTRFLRIRNKLKEIYKNIYKNG